MITIEQLDNKADYVKLSIKGYVVGTTIIGNELDVDVENVIKNPTFNVLIDDYIDDVIFNAFTRENVSDILPMLRLENKFYNIEQDLFDEIVSGLVEYITNSTFDDYNGNDLIDVVFPQTNQLGYILQ